MWLKCNNATTVTGFEPVQAKPNRFRVYLLNHSDTLPLYPKLRRETFKQVESSTVMYMYGYLIVSRTYYEQSLLSSTYMQWLLQLSAI